MRFSKLITASLPVLLLLLMVLNTVESQANVYTGSIKGKLLNAETKEVLVEANIVVMDTDLGAATDQQGEFVISNIPVGNYTLEFSYIGFQTRLQSDVIVKSKRNTYVETVLIPSPLETESIIVKGDYFPQTADKPASVIQFSSEEIRRAPGSAGDVSRIIYGLPSIAKVNDTRNSLLVRGGAAFENSFYIDNIEIPNINHFPEQGSSGGPIGMINVDFIKDVDFHSGGFSVEYGDRLSSVMDISFREGNKDALYGQLDLSMSGLGGVVEGPLAKGRGSWLFSARKSYLDLIVNAIGEDKTAVPNYGDAQAKVSFDISDNDKLTLLGVFGMDAIARDKDDALESSENMYSNVKILQNTVGINWQHLWGKKGYSKTSLSHTITDYDFTIFETLHYQQTGKEYTMMDQKGDEHEIKLRNVNYYLINHNNKINFGADIKMVIADYDHYYAPYFDPLGNETPALFVKEDITAYKIHGFLNYSWNPFNALTVVPGIRLSHFTYNNNTTVAPRFSLSYKLTERLSLHGTAGLYYQNLPLILLSQQESNKELKDARAEHYIAGFHYMLSENTRFTLEYFHKEYTNFPLEPEQPQLYIMDEMVYTGIYTQHQPLVDDGIGYAKGVEVTVQKKLAKDFYGMTSFAYFSSKYRDLNGEWHSRVNDNRFVFNAEGGYKPNNLWEFSLRWVYAGGIPNTPFDKAASEEAQRGVYDATRVNSDRLPEYHSLNVRFDRRFHFKGTNLILYLSIWNAYGRENISGYYWNQIENVPKEQKQWSTLPILGLEYEF